MKWKCVMVDKYMKMAFLEAKKAFELDEIPVGCVIVRNNEIIACGYNQKENKRSAIMHAEVIAIDNACGKLGTWRLDECDLYVTLEPCMMCLGAILEARIKNVYFGAKKSEQMFVRNKVGDFVNLFFVNDAACSKILSDFFVNKRKK